MSKETKERAEKALREADKFNFNPDKAVKFDGNKPQFYLLPIRAMGELTKDATYGAHKYSVGNWKNGGGMEFTRLLNAAKRHMDKFVSGESYDKEELILKMYPEGIHHLAMAAWSLLILCEYDMTGFGIDDRAEGQIVKPDQPWESGQRGKSKNEGDKQ